MKRQRQQGVALLEALLAIVILAIGLIGTIGLQARSYSALSDASMRAEATMAAERLLGVMSNDQANLSSYAFASGGTPDARLASWLAETRDAIPNALIDITVTPAATTTRSEVVVTIRWKRKAEQTVYQVHTVTSYISQSS